MLVAFRRRSRFTSTASASRHRRCREMVAHGHKVLVQTDAGIGIGASDEDYRRAGGEIAGARTRCSSVPT